MFFAHLCYFTLQVKDLCWEKASILLVMVLLQNWLDNKRSDMNLLLLFYFWFLCGCPRVFSL